MIAYACPQCGADEKSRERRPNGNSKCVKGHTYASAKAIPMLAGTGACPPVSALEKIMSFPPRAPKVEDDPIALAGITLVKAVYANNQSKSPPGKYTVPWKLVVELRKAIDAKYPIRNPEHQTP